MDNTVGTDRSNSCTQESDKNGTPPSKKGNLAENCKSPGRHLPGHLSTSGSTTWGGGIPLDTQSLARGRHWPGFGSHCPAD